MPLPLAAATALVNLALAWIVGLAAARFWLARGGTAPQSLDGRLSQATTIAIAACAAGVSLLLWSDAAVMAGVGWACAGSAFVTVLASTHVGHAGIVALLALAAAWRAHRLRPAVGAAMIALFAAARAASGHAGDAGIASVAVGVEWLHLVLIAFWVGAVCVAGWLVLPAWRTGTRPDAALARYLHTLSDWATVALIGIVATGAGNGLRVLSSPDELVATGYGRLLSAKIALVLVAVALGGWNRFRGLPAALADDAAAPGRTRGLRRVIAVLRIESVVLALTVLAAAVLSTSAPPG